MNLLKMSSLEIPFYKNWGYRCAQATMKSALASIHPEKNFSYLLLDKVTNRKKKEWTLFPQIAMGFLRLNIPFKYYTERIRLETYLQNDPIKQFERLCGYHSKEVLEHINFPSLEKAIRLILDTNSYTEGKPTLELLEKELETNPIICAIDFMIASGASEKEFREHVIVLTYIGSHNVYYHNNGPKNAIPNKKLSKEQFLKAWENPSLFDYGTIIPICSQK
jgi:hypothetical protein